METEVLRTCEATGRPGNAGVQGSYELQSSSWMSFVPLQLVMGEHELRWDAFLRQWIGGSELALNSRTIGRY